MIGHCIREIQKITDNLFSSSLFDNDGDDANDKNTLRTSQGWTTSQLCAFPRQPYSRHLARTKSGTFCIFNCVCICFNTGDIFEKAITSSSNPNSLFFSSKNNSSLQDLSSTCLQSNRSDLELETLQN